MTVGRGRGRRRRRRRKEREKDGWVVEGWTEEREDGDGAHPLIFCYVGGSRATMA